MSLIPSAPFAADALLPCERVLRQPDGSRESGEIGKTFLLRFAVYAPFQELEQLFFLFQRQRIGSRFDFTQGAHNVRKLALLW